MLVTRQRACYGEGDDAQAERNPYVDALPTFLGEDEFVRCSTDLPELPACLLEASPEKRYSSLDSAFDVVIPFAACRDLYVELDRMIRSGYEGRNPLCPRVVEWQYGVANRKGQRKPTTASRQLFVGVSGAGKTTMVRTVLACYPQVIEHVEYRGQAFLAEQIVYLAIDMPHDATRKGFARSFFAAVDHAVGTNYSEQYRKGTSVDTMISAIQVICVRFGIGVIVVDEFQNLNVARSGGDTLMFQMLDEISNTVRVPLVLVGTPAVERLFEGAPCRTQRRYGSKKTIFVDRFVQPDEEWGLLVEALWDRLLISKRAALTDQVRNTLYDLTQGITSFLVRLLVAANEDAIETGCEVVDGKVLRRAYRERLEKLHGPVNALRSGKEHQYEDLYSARTREGACGGRDEVDLVARKSAQSPKASRADDVLVRGRREAPPDFELTEEARVELQRLAKQRKEALEAGQPAKGLPRVGKS